MRLIDADELCRHLSDWQFGSMTDGKHDAEYEVINKVIDGIEKEPTVDAVSVVRCKDCKHYREADPGHPDCDWCNRMICGTIRKGFFCADGERRSE